MVAMENTVVISEEVDEGFPGLPPCFPLFDGISSEDYRCWRTQLECIIECVKKPYRFSSTFCVLRGAAASVGATYFYECKANNTKPTYEGLLAILDRHFHREESYLTMRFKLSAMKGSRDNLRKFVTEFSVLADRIGSIPESELVSTFFNCIKDQELKIRALDLHPESLKRAVDAVLTVAAVYNIDDVAHSKKTDPCQLQTRLDSLENEILAIQKSMNMKKVKSSQRKKDGRDSHARSN